MSKKKKLSHHEADISNKNEGTSGKNITRKKNEENHEKQTAENAKKKK